jgi:hypothetical protein
MARLLPILVLSSERINKMKTIKSLLFLSMFAILIISSFSGCYTQLAYVADEPDPAVYHPPIAVDQTTTTVIVNYIPYDNWEPPINNSLPVASSTSATTVNQSNSQTRDSGYQRSTCGAQTPSTNSSTRTSGSTRGNR